MSQRILDSGQPETLAIVAGAVCVFAGVAPVALTLSQGQFVSAGLALVVGLPFVAGGVWLARRRTGMWIDLERGDLVSWSKVLGKGQEHRVPLSRFDRVRLIQETTQLARDTLVYYKVSLAGPEPIEGVLYRVARPGPQEDTQLSYHESREEAEAAARDLSEYLKLPLSK